MLTGTELQHCLEMFKIEKKMTSGAPFNVAISYYFRPKEYTYTIACEVTHDYDISTPFS